MTVWLSLGISLVAIAIAMILMRRMIDRRTGSAALLEEIRREVGAIVTELNQTTERNIELIEDRIRSLQETIGQADKRLSNLKREVGRQEAATAVYSQLGRFRPPRASSGEDGQAGAAAGDDARSGGQAAGGSEGARDESAAVGKEAARRDEVSGGHEANDRDEASGGDEDNDRDRVRGREDVSSAKDRVLSLYRQGVPVERIAARVGTAVSEVELIVSLGER